MTPERVAHINAERLSSWANILLQHHATPAVLIGIGHDDRSGEIRIITCEELPDDFVLQMLRFAIAQLEK